MMKLLIIVVLFVIRFPAY
ncbi:type I toxin-antitoxin system Ibs family toxin [Escherichia coli]|nr:type I toxin-antitoxin system Ibs family toxin [Escherichia coli]RHG48150.1 type I toxin-antitoxin system Ibs family toxin [Escherichia coli]